MPLEPIESLSSREETAWIDDGPARPPARTVRELEAVLAATQAELIACQRRAVLGSLAGMAVHEFNNLMTPIVARVEAALNDHDPAFTRKTLERTLVQAQRAISLCGHLLGFARDRVLPVEPCSVAGVVQEAIESAARPFEKDGIELRVTVPAELQVYARTDLLCQVLLNLLVNARQALKGKSGLMAISAHADGEYVQIDVRDNGQGIPADKLARVVNPFLAADPTRLAAGTPGVGLGLSVCRLIAFQHGASLRALGNEGPGCTFRLRWPRRPRES
jgi:signal transduction histidine kinase